MKISKLNSKGVSHLVLPLVVVVAVGTVGTYFLVSSRAASAPCVKRSFGQGDSGDCVKAIQIMVNSANAASGSSKRVSVDGGYGSGTKNAVTYFQAHHSLSPDGGVGSGTWKALCKKAKSLSANPSTASAELNYGKKIAKCSAIK